MRHTTDFVSQMRENGKRRIWLLALFSFVLMLSYPMYAALRFGKYGRMSVDALRVGYDVLDLGGVTAVFVTLGAVWCAVEGFSWLHSRRKTDMYMSQPITAGRRFAFTYLNGILLYFAPYLAAVLLTLLIASGAGTCSVSLLVYAAFNFAAAFVYFLAVYNLALIAVMVSGRKSMTGFFLLVGFLYDIVLRAIWESYCNSFFVTYYNPGSGTAQYISPPMRLGQLVNQVGFLWEDKPGVEMTAFGVLKTLAVPMLPGLGILLLEAAVFGMTAYYCYQKRPLEAAAQTVAFQKAKSPLKVLMMVPAGLFGALCFRDVSGSDALFVGLSGLLLGVLFAQAVMEIIYEGDIRAFARHKISFATGFAATLFLYLFFAFDLSGYDSWVPSEGKVRSAAIQINFANRYRSLNVHIDKNGVVTWDDGYTLNTMKLTDVSPVLALAHAGMGKDANRDLRTDTEVNCVVRYDMKGGGVKYREFAIDYEREEETFNLLFADGAYQDGVGQLFLAQMDDIFGRGRAYYSDGTQDAAIEDQSALPLMQAYRADMREMTFSDVKDVLPCGTVLVRYKAESGYEQTLEYAVFPSYENTLRYLRGKHVEPYSTIDPDTVDSVRFIVYNTEDDGLSATVAVELGSNWESYITQAAGETIEREYTDPAEIEEVLKCLSPMPGGYSDYAYTQTAYEKDVAVWVVRLDGEEPDSKYRDEREYVVKKGMLPEFVKRDVGRE